MYKRFNDQVNPSESPQKVLQKQSLWLMRCDADGKMAQIRQHAPQIACPSSCFPAKHLTCETSQQPRATHDQKIRLAAHQKKSKKTKSGCSHVFSFPFLFKKKHSKGSSAASKDQFRPEKCPVEVCRFSPFPPLRSTELVYFLVLKMLWEGAVVR